MSAPAASAAFDDVLAANAGYAAGFTDAELAGRAAKGLAVITCMDSRIDPLAILGLQVGDAKILRNAGGRVTDEVLRTLVLAVFLLGVDRIMVMPHTRCKMASGSEADVQAAVSQAGGPDVRSLSFLTAQNQRAELDLDLQRIRSYPYLHTPPAPELAIGGFLYDTETGAVTQVG